MKVICTFWLLSFLVTCPLQCGRHLATVAETKVFTIVHYAEPTFSAEKPLHLKKILLQGSVLGFVDRHLKKIMYSKNNNNKKRWFFSWNFSAVEENSKIAKNFWNFSKPWPHPSASMPVSRTKSPKTYAIFMFIYYLQQIPFAMPSNKKYHSYAKRYNQMDFHTFAYAPSAA